MVDSSDGIRTVVLRRNQGSSLGFSIMGGAGFSFPPVIYGIEKDSPAARSGLLEAGDIILAINEREVVKLSTKEVLKCLRLSGDIVNIKYKRDAQIVNRVREFLSAPNYLEGGDYDYHHHHPSAGSQVLPPSGKTRKSPSLSSSRSSSATSQSNTPPGEQHTDAIDSQPNSKAPNPNNISFSDDIFINHSSSPPISSGNSNHKRISSTNGNNKNNWKTPAASQTPAKKSYEAFVMTGDAILNISRVDPNDGLCRRSSPTKTKLTPMSVPPHQIYTALSCKRPNPKTKTPSPPSEPIMVEQNPASKDVSESSDISPPLPPPPKSSSTSASNSSATEPTHVTVKSDNLPPPPASLMENYDDEAELLLHNAQQSHSNGNGFARAEDLQNFAKAKGIKGQRSNDGKNTNGNNNNEDTSISSSVMSDSGEELEDDDEKPKTSRKKHSASSEYNGSRKGSDKERYNEYVLLNGTNGPTNDDEDDDDESSASSARAKGYEKMAAAVDSDDQDDVEELEGGLSRQQQQIRRFQSLHSSSGGGESFNSSGGDSDGSDVESMRVPVTKAVDIPSAERLAKRLFALDGFKVSDVWRQLSKANDFSRTVATEYLSYFDFKEEQLDVSLRKFLLACPLRGETTEKERVLMYFSSRYVDCNQDVYGSPDAVHTLACALMLLNSDLYSPAGGAQGRRMTSKDFIHNLSGLNDGQNFPEQILRKLYQSIKAHPLVFPDGEDTESNRDVLPIDPSVNTSSKEFKRGYLKKKSTFELGGKKTPLGKRSWKMHFCRLRDLMLVLSTDETNKSSVTQNTQTIKLHHAHAAVAQDYRKKPYVFHLTLADRSQYLFQSSDIREMNSWIDNINLIAAKYSSPALEAPCGSRKRFERPLLPSTISRLSPRDQLVTHQGAIAKWEEEQEDLNQVLASKKKVPSKREVKERQSFYATELNRYKTYVDVLERMNEKIGGGQSSGPEELIQLQVLPHPPSVLIEMDECS